MILYLLQQSSTVFTQKGSNAGVLLGYNPVFQVCVYLNTSWKVVWGRTYSYKPKELKVRVTFYNKGSCLNHCLNFSKYTK